MIQLFPTVLATVLLICFGGFVGGMVDFDGDGGFESGAAGTAIAVVFGSLAVDIMTLP